MQLRDGNMTNSKFSFLFSGGEFGDVFRRLLGEEIAALPAEHQFQPNPPPPWVRVSQLACCGKQYLATAPGNVAPARLARTRAAGGGA